MFHVVDVPPIANRPRRAVHILFSHELLDVTWSVLIDAARGVAVEPFSLSGEADGFFVLAGEVELTLGDRSLTGGPGTWMAAAPGELHALGNAGDRRASILNVRAPDARFAETLRR